MEHIQDIKTMKRGLILLFASIGLVYFVYISLHADQMKSLGHYMMSDHMGATTMGSGDTAILPKQIPTQITNSDGLLDIGNTTDTIDETILGDLGESTTQLNKNNVQDIQVGSSDLGGETFAEDMTKSFEGMKLWNGKNQIVQELGIRYQYALKDTGDMYFFFLGSRFYDFRLILSELGGNVVEITNQKDILDNGLYADKITYLKLPAYKNKTLMIVIQKGIDKRLIIVPHPIYYKKKSLIKTLFEQAYRTTQG